MCGLGAAMIETLQDPQELDELLSVVRQEKCHSFLEIGSKFGGSLQAVSTVLEAGARVVSVDLPNGTRAFGQSKPSLEGVVASLKKDGFDAHLIWGDSTDPKVIKQVWDLGPYDFVWIDGNHQRPYVEKDFANYGSIAKMVAFHDIAWRREDTWVGIRIDVPEFWNEIKGDYRYVEIKHCKTGKNNGIGVLWR